MASARRTTLAAFDPVTLDRWRSLAIVDRDGTTVGTVSEFYLDRETGDPTWALVEIGLFGANQTFVPLIHATEVSDGLQVPYEKRHIKNSPRVDPHDELTPEEEATLFAHYGVEYQPSTAPGPDTVGPPGPVPAEPASVEGPGPVPADPESVDGPGPVPADPESVERPGPVPAGPEAVGLSGEVPREPGSPESTAVTSSEPEAVGSAWTAGPGSTETVPAGSTQMVPAQSEPTDSTNGLAGPDEATGAVPAEPGTAEPVTATRTEPSEPWSTPEQDREEPTSDQPDLSRPAPVEPGLPGSTSATPSAPTPTSVDNGGADADPSAQRIAEAAPTPGEAGWAPGAPGGFEEPEPAHRPKGASDRWREAKLAAERDRIARAAADQSEERSPLERARRRLERLVGGGQEPADPEGITPADRDAAERARRERLGLDEDDPRSH
jgi:sporulation protein YlmC with PRC-barrel domain